MNKTKQIEKSKKKYNFQPAHTTAIAIVYSRKLAKRCRSFLWPPISSTLLVVLLRATEDTVFKTIVRGWNFFLFSYIVFIAMTSTINRDGAFLLLCSKLRTTTTTQRLFQGRLQFCTSAYDLVKHSTPKCTLPSFQNESA